MATGYHDFVAGEALTAANLESYCELQSVMQFASAAARDTALASVKVQGTQAYLLDVKCVTIYSGSAWSTVGPVHGGFRGWTPVVVQGVTATATFPFTPGYSQVGRRVTFDAVVSVTNTTTAASPVTITTPLPIASRLVTGAGSVYVGQCSIIDASASLIYYGRLTPATSTTLKFLNDGTTTPFAYYGNGGFTAALASGDSISVTGTYETDADY